MRSIVVCLAMAVSLAACDPTRPVSDADRAALEAHETQWGARDFHSYEFDYSETQSTTSFNVHITVVNDTVATVIDTQTGQPPAVPRTWPTIDDLFNEADFAVNEDGISVSLEYDDQYGYLTLFRITSNNSGGGFLARMSGLTPTG
jgi:hypothetical protein